tara:strand:+ start:2960 stop:3772 length:813 start_codon:yes stop_codon:yes gene_type:complete
MSFVSNMLQFLSLNHESKADIIGLHLTEANIRSLLTNTATLLNILTKQLHDIQALYYTDSAFISKLKPIQERQLCFQNTMKLLIEATRLSSEPWLQELNDGQQAIVRKVKLCNRMSMPQNIGIKAAALRYLPLIAHSYRFIMPNLQKLQKELETGLADKALWASKHRRVGKGGYTPKPSPKGNSVYFFKDVKARWIPAVGETGEEGKFADFTVPLTNGKKNTAGKLKARQNLQKKRFDGRGNHGEVESGGGTEDGEAGGEFVMGVAPMPL